jgi:hypothetical protein
MILQVARVEVSLMQVHGAPYGFIFQTSARMEANDVPTSLRPVF